MTTEGVVRRSILLDAPQHDGYNPVQPSSASEPETTMSSTPHRCRTATIRLCCIAVVGAVLGGCFPDDWNGQPYQPDDTRPTFTVPTTTDTAVPVGSVDPLVGVWVSEGNDISPLFSNLPFFYEYIEATFRADGTVVTFIEDRDGATYVTSGTYVANDSTVPGVITLQQVEPYSATLQGIYLVEGDVLTYEVVQLTPDYGYNPPTPALGFGSTNGPNLTAGVNIQTFERD